MNYNDGAKAKAKADAITLEEFERRMRGGGNGGGSGGEEPNFISRWLRQKGRETVEAKMARLEGFNRQNARNILKSRNVLRRLGEEFDAIVNHEGIEADLAAVKALWTHGFAAKAAMTA